MKLQLLFIIFLFFSSCNCNQKQELKSTLSLSHDSLFNNERQTDIYEMGIQISKDVVIDSNCDKSIENESIDPISTTHMIFKIIHNDTISVYHNGAIFYIGPLEEINNRIILVYDEKYKRITLGKKGFLNIDNTKEDVFIIKFIERNS